MNSRGADSIMGKAEPHALEAFIRGD